MLVTDLEGKMGNEQLFVALFLGYSVAVTVAYVFPVGPGITEAWA